MLRVLALLTYLAVLLVPLTLAQAQPTCAAAAAAPHAMTVGAANPDDQTQIPTHHCVTDVCKQMCSAVAILPSVQPSASRVAVILPPLRPSDSLLASQLYCPSERPPKTPV